MSSNHELFLERLELSRPTVWLIAKWLNAQGHIVTVNATSRAPSAAQWRQHVDCGDLFLNQRVEVKQLSRHFTCAADWDFPDWMICAKHSFDNAVPKPCLYVFVNAKRTHIACVLAGSAERWVVKNRPDPRYGNTQDCYYCKLSDVQFGALPVCAP